MKTLPEEHLPLYLQGESLFLPLVAYIISDEVIYLDESAASEGYWYVALSPLMKLFVNEQTKHAFPAQTRFHLEEMEKMDWKGSKALCICGDGPGDPPFLLHCLALNMTIKPLPPEPVVSVHDFALVEKTTRQGDDDLRVYPLPYTVSLTAEEAVLNFANMNIVKNIYHEGLMETIFNLQSARERIEQDLNKEPLRTHLALFCLDYLEWLRDQLLAQTLSCSKVLQASGAPVLALFSQLPAVRTFIEDGMNALVTKYNHLSRPQKLQYFLLFGMLQEYNELSFLQDFFQENGDIMAQLQTAYFTPYPNIPENPQTLVSWRGVHEKYGFTYDDEKEG